MPYLLRTGWFIQWLTPYFCSFRSFSMAHFFQFRTSLQLTGSRVYYSNRRKSIVHSWKCSCSSSIRYKFNDEIPSPFGAALTMVTYCNMPWTKWIGKCPDWYHHLTNLTHFGWLPYSSSSYHFIVKLNRIDRLETHNAAECIRSGYINALFGCDLCQSEYQHTSHIHKSI